MPTQLQLVQPIKKTPLLSFLARGRATGAAIAEVAEERDSNCIDKTRTNTVRGSTETSLSGREKRERGAYRRRRCQRL